MIERAAVFDLDGTLLPGTSAERLFVPYLARRGALGARQLVPALATAAALPLRGRTVALRANKRWATGLDAAEVHALADRFVREYLGALLCGRMLMRMRTLRSCGHRIYLLSGTIAVLAEAVAHHLGMDDWVATSLEVEDGCYTGRIDGPHVFAGAKLDGLAVLLERHGVALEESWGFADHDTDVAFLERFGHPVAAYPDASLRRVAAARGWEVYPA